MNELEELFDEIITFEEEIKNNDPQNSTYPDRIKAKRVFHEYLEWRFNKIQSKIDNQANWGQ